jgi:uncharacterized protein YbjT (DUF2867 family)
MRILVTGAYGFIGSHILTQLLAAGHTIVGAGRSVREAARRWPQIRWAAIDFNRATQAQDWLPHLAGIDAVVNCVGLLQDAPGNAVRAAQVEGAVALFAACEQARVRRVIHLSAAGVEEERPSAFMRTKREADAALMASGLDWVILRPSVVVGHAAYGGSALLRALAALPMVVPVLPGAGQLQIVQADDVAATVVFFLQFDAPARKVLELVGPERMPLVDVVLAYRRWLGLPPARLIRIPRWLARTIYLLGDFVSLFGWRPPIRSTAGEEIARGAVGDPTEWTRVTGITPRSLQTALAADPATVQERWFARLYLLKALVIGFLAAFWLGTGIVSLGPGYHIGENIMRAGHVEGPLATLAIIGGGLIDVLVGLGMAFRRTARPALILSLIVSVVYFVLGTYLVPQLWLDPLGPMMKIWPICVLALVALAILDDR